MAEVISDKYSCEIRPVCDGKYKVKVFINKESGCEYSEEEYRKRQAQEQRK